MGDVDVESILPSREIVYCAKCGIPPEYCEYGPDFESVCDPWLRKKHPELHAQLKALRGDTSSAAKADNEQGADEEEEKDTRPTEPWTTEERLTAFYEEYQPDKVADVPSLLEKYAGKEDKLFMALVKKYGPEPEDPYYAEDSDEDDEDGDEDEELEEGMESLAVSGDGKKRRGVKAKKNKKIETKVIIQTEKRKKRKATTIVMGMDTVPGLKLKDVSKAFSKRFAGSSSVKNDAKGAKQIIIQGDHMEDVAEMVVSKFQVPGNCVFLDFDGDVVPYK